MSGVAPVASGTGQPSGDKSTLKVVPVSLSAVYRFDYFLERRGFPLVPFGKLGLDWAYWQITDGNDEIATDGRGGHGRGGTFGWHAAAGLALVLDFFDPDAARDFDNELGVNHTALVFQYTYADISGLGQVGPHARRRHQLVARADVRVLSRPVVASSSSTTAPTSPAGSGRPASGPSRRRWRTRSATMTGETVFVRARRPHRRRRPRRRPGGAPSISPSTSRRTASCAG